MEENFEKQNSPLPKIKWVGRKVIQKKLNRNKSDMSVTSECFIKSSSFVLVQTENLVHLGSSSISVTSRDIQGYAIGFI